MDSSRSAAGLHTVIFEDHTWLGWRPLSASTPVFELRCGIFGTRERAELAGAVGTLLCRRQLAPLLNPGPWQVNRAPAAGTGGAAPSLWLAARLAPSLDLFRALAGPGEGSVPFVWWDEDGLLAARLDAAATGAAFAAWQAWAAGQAPEFRPSGGWQEAATLETAKGGRLELPAAVPADEARALAAALDRACGGRDPALRRIWDLVPATAAALAGDLAGGLEAGGWSRRPFGLFAEARGGEPWRGHSLPAPVPADGLPAGTHLLGEALWCAGEIAMAPTAVIDTRQGPVVIDRGCEIGPHTLLEGPLYLAPACRVKAGARLYGESSFGIGNRLAGEIGESTFGDFTNKQHEGFIGHAVLGSWVNLGAMTTCSDLKNNYGTVKVDLGDGLESTGQRFVGLLAGDHVKTAIGTLFNTGTCVGFASNIFGAGMPPKHVPAFSWGGREGDPAYGLGPAAATAGIVMGRRGCRFLAEHGELFAYLEGRR